MEQAIVALLTTVISILITFLTVIGVLIAVFITSLLLIARKEDDQKLIDSKTEEIP